MRKYVVFNEKRSRITRKYVVLTRKDLVITRKIWRFNEKRSRFNEKRSRYNNIIEWKKYNVWAVYVTVILHLKYSKIITFSMRTGQTKF